MKHIRFLALVALSLQLSAISLFAAEALPEGGTPAAKTTLLLGLIPILVPVLIAVLKFFVPAIPSVALPILAPLLGAATEWLSTGTFDSGTVLGAIAGSAGVGLREIVDQLKKRNLSTLN